MSKSRFRRFFLTSAGFILLAAAFLWAFNAVAALVGGPQAQFKDAIAAITLLLILRWILLPRRVAQGRNRHIGGR